MVWICSVVGTAEGVAGGGVTITGSVVGTGVADEVAGVSVPEPEVHPAENTQTRITRTGIRAIRRFIARGLIFIGISDLCFTIPMAYQWVC